MTEFDVDFGMKLQPVEKIVRGAWYVTVTATATETGGYGATADKTAQEVYDAYQAGYAVYAIATTSGDDFFPVVLPLLVAFKLMDAILLAFACTGSVSPLDSPSNIVVAWNNGRWVLWERQMDSLGISGASVGQVLVVAAVDDKGLPTGWTTRNWPT